MEREKVYKIIDGERDYQSQMTASPTRPDMIENLGAGDHLLAMEHCLAEARRIWYGDSAPYEATGHFIRKATALGVRWMETFSAPPRT